MKILKLTNLMLQTTAVRLVESENDPTNLEASGETSLPHFDLVAYTGGKVMTKDIPIPLVVELTGIDIPKQKIPVRFEHKSNQGVGHTETILVSGMELLAAGVISRDTVWARDVKNSAVNGFPWQISMGGPIHEAEYIPFGQKVTVNGQTFLEAQYDERTLDTVDKFRGIGIQEFCSLACGGKYLPSARRDVRGWLEAAFSSTSLPGILSNIANKVLLEGFLQMDDTWKKIVKIASVSNFLLHEPC